jgi:hypothetical protein
MEGTGKGRIELASSKFLFDYESQINKNTNHFDLAMDFPIIGEKKLSLSLIPKEANSEITHSELLHLIESQIGERYNKVQIVNAMEEFFVLTSEFLYFKSQGKLASAYSTHFENNHFIMQRLHGQFKFEVEGYDEEHGFFRRILVKIYPKSPDSDSSLFSLFLVPETCDR